MLALNGNTCTDFDPLCLVLSAVALALIPFEGYGMPSVYPRPSS